MKAIPTALVPGVRECNRPSFSGARTCRTLLGSSLVALVAVAAASWPWPDARVHGGRVHVAGPHESPPSSARPSTVVRPVSCEKLPEVAGKMVRTVLVNFPPGAHTPRHHHPGSVTAFVVSGVLWSQLDGGAIQTFSAGQSWFEPFGAVHDFAENASLSEPAQLLAVFVTDENCGPLTIFH